MKTPCSIRLGLLLPLALAAGVLAPACAEDDDRRYPGSEREPIGEVSSAISKDLRMARYKLIKSGAASKGIPAHGYLLAGIVYQESGLAQCHSEATWACQGPGSPDCGGGPILAGAGDGPCANQQGGLGMYQFDAGTYAQTIAAYGPSVLTVEGGTQHAVDFVVNMVRKSVYTTNAETNEKALAWINAFDIGNATLRDQWIKTVLRYYNGCQPTSTCWNDRYPKYNQGLTTVLDETGLPFWASDAPPTGYLDNAGCDTITGWAQDPDAKAATITVKLFFDGGPGAGHELATVANVERADLCGPLGSCNHGYSVPPPFSLFDGAPHDVFAFGIGDAGGANAQLAQSPLKLNCPTAVPAGIARWITNPTSLAAWKFDGWYDQLPVAKDVVDKIPRDADLPATPLLQQAEGDPAVYLVDGGFKHHVPSPAVLSAWRLGFGDVQKTTQATIDALVTAAPVRPRPVLVADSSGRLLLVDDALPKPPGSGGSGSGGASGAAGSSSAKGGAGGGASGSAGAGAKGGTTGTGSGAAGQGGQSTGGTSGGGGSGAGTGNAAGSAGKSSSGAAGKSGQASGGTGGNGRDRPRTTAVTPSEDGGACSMAGTARPRPPSFASVASVAMLAALGARFGRRRR